MERIAVPAESVIDDGERVAASPGRAAAAIVVLVLSAVMAVLPGLTALGLWADPAGRLAAGLASLVAVFGVVRLAAAASID